MIKANIREYILTNLSDHPNAIATLTAKRFRVTRQTAVNYLNELISEGVIKATGQTKAREYKLVNFIKKEFYEKVVPEMEEHILWRRDILPLMSGLNSNIVDICQHGFNEIVRNVFDHSQSDSMLYRITRNAACVEFSVDDHGVGIFNKIQKDFNLDDPRHALLELSKGKLTSDPANHSGEGIFFTSRIFDSFEILSKPLYFHQKSKGDGWLLDTGEDKTKGTFVNMEISPYSKRTVKGVFDEFAPDKDSYGFTKTHVPIELAKYEGEQLVSRSQARRLLTHFERFQEVMLDFEGVTMIGQAFADEIFRVYAAEHPEIKILSVNTSNDVMNMINRARAARAEDKGRE